MADEKKGLSAHLDAAIAEHYVEDDQLTLPVPPPAKAQEADTDETPPEPSEERPRGPDGKFLPKDSAKAKPSSDDEEPAQAKAPTEPTQAAEPPEREPVEPHPRWDGKLKAEFAKWPPDVQQAFRARYDATEADYTRKTQEVAEQRRAFEPLLAETQKHQPFLQQIGYTPDRFMGESIAVAQRLMSGQPQHQGQAIAYLMNLHRIPPEAVLQALGVPLNPGETLQVNPVLQTLHQSQLELQARLQQFETRTQQAERMHAQAEFDQIGQTTDQNGNPVYPYWDRVKDAMINLVASGQSDSWDKAYKKAVRMDDELYEQTFESERQRVLESESKRRQEALAKAKKAQPVVTSSSAPSGGSERRGLDAHLSAAMDRFYSD